MTLDHCDRNGHIINNIFHCYAMILSSLAKVMGLQSSPFFLAHFGENEQSTIFRNQKDACMD